MLLMRCPYCGSDNDHVIDSRSMGEGTSIRRRRECLGCSRRFTTYEHVDAIPVMIVKKGGEPDPYDREKIAAGVRTACYKRQISEDRIQEITSLVEQEVLSQPEKEVESSFVGELVMNHLRDLDEVAYVRFASVYRSFKDVNEFASEISKFLKSSKPEKKAKRKNRQ